MTLNISTRSIHLRLRLLVGLAMSITALIGGSAYFALSRAESLAEKQLGERLLLGEKARLELSSRMLADSLAATLSRLEGHEAQIEALRERVSGLRYESDNSGYFFVYEGTVCQVMGPNPAMEEKDLADRVDSNGVHFIRELATQARQGGGFVNYVSPKPGTTEQPKLSFAVMIPKTTFWIGTGVYIDHLARLQAEGTASMRAAVRPWFAVPASEERSLYWCSPAPRSSWNVASAVRCGASRRRSPRVRIKPPKLHPRSPMPASPSPPVRANRPRRSICRSWSASSTSSSTDGVPPRAPTTTPSASRPRRSVIRPMTLQSGVPPGRGG
jgi:hypothetical protein